MATSLESAQLTLGAPDLKRQMATGSLSEQASVAIGHRRLAALLRDVVAEQSVEAVLARVVTTLQELIHCEDVVVWETVGVDELAVAVACGEDEEQLRALRIPFGDGLTGAAALGRCSVVANDAHIDPRARVVPGTELTPEAVVCLPLLGRGRILGVLSLYRRGASRAFASDEVELVADFAAVAALALDNAETRAELELLATTDDLTGLANRRRFRSELEREIAAAARYKTPLSLLLLDLDDFKAINDRYGHDAGDQALKDVADALRQRLRAPDLAARIGGDEFAILLPQTSRLAAETLAHSIAQTIRNALSPPLSTSASIGISSLRGGQTHDLLADADRFLYQAKRSHPTPRSIRLTAPANDPRPHRYQSQGTQ
jgi:diguanylate cyclase (GGDEF)-like protein